MSLNRRQVMLGLALAVMLVAAYFAPEPNSGVVAPIAKPAAPSPALRAESAGLRPTAANLEVLSIRPRIAGENELTTLAPVAWEVPAPPPPPPPPPPPQAPPLPFKVIGLYTEGEQVTLVLEKTNVSFQQSSPYSPGQIGFPIPNNLHVAESFVVRVGDIIDNLYKVESLKDGVLTLLYLPLQQKQTLVVSSSN